MAIQPREQIPSCISHEEEGRAIIFLNIASVLCYLEHALFPIVSWGDVYKASGIRRNEQFLSSILNHSPLPTWIAGPDGYVIRANRALCLALNLSEDLVVGKYNILLDPNIEQAGLMEQVRTVFDDRKIASFELLWRASLYSETDYQVGRDRNVSVILYPIADDAGVLRNVVCQIAFEGIRPMCEGLDYEFQNGDDKLAAINEGLLVFHDSEVLVRILSNLLQNACKYTDAGHVRLTIGQRVDVAPPEFSFIIEDSGIGISALSKELIFNAFTQVDSSCSRTHGGLGLGLAICSKLVMISDGKIDVTSEPGQGSCFTVTLPLEVQPLEPKHLEQEQAAARTSATEALQGLRILLVEDDGFNRLYFESLMQKLGLDCTVADGGHTALEVSQRKRFDVILMDLHMPDLSGFQTMDLIRAEELNQATPVYALTADNSVGMREKCLSKGMVDVLTKPISPSRLQSILEAIAKG